MPRELRTVSMRHLEESFLDDDLESEKSSTVAGTQKPKNASVDGVGNGAGSARKNQDPGLAQLSSLGTPEAEKQQKEQVEKTRSASLDKDVTPQTIKGKQVENHPLARTSSNSSGSSMDDDYTAEPHFIGQTPKTTRGQRSRGSSFGRLRDIIGMQEEGASGGEGVDGSYYNSATAIWQNRGKIFTNLRKQASDGVRRNLPGLSNSSSFEVSIPDAVDADSSVNTTPHSSEHSGLMKVETDKIVESKEDSEVTSFLHGLRGKVVDPLQLLYYKKKEEDEKKEEMDDFSHPDMRKNSEPRLRKDSDAKTEKKADAEKSNIPQKSDVTSSLSMSLSALLGGIGRNGDDNEEESIPEVESVKATTNNDEDAQNTDAMNNNNTKPVEVETSHIKPHETVVPVEPPSLLFVMFMVLLVYTYLVYPVPDRLQVIVKSFLFGILVATVFLCIAAPKSSRPRPVLKSMINKSIPYDVPKSVFDPEHPIKGWMNESQSYDPESYHVSNTQSVFVTLDGNTMRLQTPHRSITRRSIYNEGSIPVSNVIYQRLYDITTAKVYLKPDGLVKKRVWSKKYPICVEIPVKLKTDEQVSASTTTAKDLTTKTESSSGQENVVVYLFGRTDRQKEEWFYRIQRSINLSLRQQKLAEKEKDKGQAKESKEEGSPGMPIIEDEWGVIENHYEEETFVASTLCKVETVNANPLKAYRDYFVHVSRLFPDPDAHSGLSEKKPKVKSEGSESEASEPGLEVAWLNVFVGRVMFDFLRQEWWAKWLSVKIQKKLDKIKLPYFMEELKLTEMNLGSTVPLIHQISLPKLDSRGIWMEMEVTYSGSLQMTLKTKMVLTKLGKQELGDDSMKQSWKKSSAITDSDAEDSAESSDDDESAVAQIVEKVHTHVPQIVKDAVKYVGTETTSPAPNPNAPKKWVRIVDSIAKSKYFKKATETEYIRKKLETVSNTPMLLSVELLELKGTVAVNIAPPPTDRLWYGFREPPHMVLKAHPKVGERVVKTSHITDWIENKLQQEFIKVLVMPNMDDIPIPIMFNNR